MIDRMSLADGLAIQLGCGHAIIRKTAEGKIFCNDCNEELIPDSARMTEQDERSGAEISGEQEHGKS